nr:PD-(D/E)XK nuclease family transposase [Faecalicoccus pleomorphus]
MVNSRENIMYEMMLDLYAIYGNQELKEDELDLGLKSLYKIGIADFVVDPDFEGLLTEFDLRNKKGQPLGRDLEIIVLKMIQLVKVPVMDPSQMSLLQKWCFFIKYYADDKKQDIIQELIRLEEGIAMAEYSVN